MRLTPAQVDLIKTAALDVLGEGASEQPIHRIALEQGVRL